MRGAHLIAITCAVALLSAYPAWATNGPQFIGYGPYQKSMAGAVTAAPETASTMMTNPAGIALIGARTDFDFDIFLPDSSLDFSAMGGESRSSTFDLSGIPSFGLVGDFGEYTLGIGAFVVGGSGADYGVMNVAPFGAILSQLTGQAPTDFTLWKGELYSQYVMWRFTPTIAKKINEALSLGATLNIGYQTLGFTEKFYNSATGQSMGVTTPRNVGALGFGASFGAVFKVNDMIQFGAKYETEQSFEDWEYNLKAGDIISPPDAFGNSLVNRDGTYSLNAGYPQQVAFGVAIKPAKGLTITSDVKWINFSATHDKMQFKGEYDVVNLATGSTGQTGDEFEMVFGWEDVVTYAIGLEYVADKTTFRAGYSIGNSPIAEENIFFNSVFPAITENHLGFGVDFDLGNWILGLAYMKAFSNEITGKGDIPVLGQTLDSGIKMGLEETSYLVGITYRP